MADVFISYASEDRDRVRPLAEALMGRGFSVWWDRSLASGQDYTSIIEKELGEAKAVIVVWTRASAASTFVRDEAGRARDRGQLLPVKLDEVMPPLGFAQYQADDFTKWGGQRNAAQVQILEESIKAKLSGRDVNSAEIERKRRRLGARIRMVSLLTVLALIVVIAVGAKNFFQPPKIDPREHLLELLEQGKLTPEEAIQLAQLLQTDALGTGPQTAEAHSDAPGSPMGSRSEVAPSAGPTTEDQLSAGVTEASFTQDATETYNQAFAALLTHPAKEVRDAAVKMTQEGTRDQGVQEMWAYAQAHPDDPARAQIYLVCGAIGEKNNNPLGQRALEVASNLEPANSRVWRMLSHSYQRTQQTQEAQATLQVGAAVDAQAAGQTEQAEQHLEQALPNLQSTGSRAFVASQLGQIAERRQDWNAASARFSMAYQLREQAAAASPTAPAATGLQDDAQHLVTALDRSGRTRDACDRLAQAQQAHDVNAPDDALVNRCQTQFRTHVRPGVLQRNRATVATTTATTTP